MKFFSYLLVLQQVYCFAPIALTRRHCSQLNAEFDFDVAIIGKKPTSVVVSLAASLFNRLGLPRIRLARRWSSASRQVYRFGL